MSASPSLDHTITPLHLAAANGHLVVTSLQITAGAELEARDDNGRTPLATAAFEGEAEIVAALLGNGANPNTVDALGSTPMQDAIARKKTSCVAALLEVSDLGVSASDGKNAFHSCVATANEECFQMLLPRVSDIDVRTVRDFSDDEFPFNRTALHLACERGQHRMVKALLRHGASRTASDSMQRKPLHYAAACGHLSCVVRLLGSPGDYKLTPEEVNATSEYGHTPLHFAAFHGQAQCVGALLAAGAHLDATDAANETPLMFAQELHPENAELLALLSGGGPADAPGTTCNHCGAREAEARLRACSGCYSVRYCCDACSQAAWPAHKEECSRRQAERKRSTRVLTINADDPARHA